MRRRAAPSGRWALSRPRLRRSGFVGSSAYRIARSVVAAALIGGCAYSPWAGARAVLRARLRAPAVVIGGYSCGVSVPVAGGPVGRRRRSRPRLPRRVGLTGRRAGRSRYARRALWAHLTPSLRSAAGPVAQPPTGVARRHPPHRKRVIVGGLSWGPPRRRAFAPPRLGWGRGYAASPRRFCRLSCERVLVGVFAPPLRFASPPPRRGGSSGIVHWIYTSSVTASPSHLPL